MTNSTNKIITSLETINFTVNQSGLYALTVSARCEKTQDLRIEIDNQYFREIYPSKYIQKFKIPPAWNGNLLMGATQINIFILNLQEGQHLLSFIPKSKAIIENWNIFPINSSQHEFQFDLQSEFRNIQPWINFILIDVPLDSIDATASTAWSWHDGDDLQLKIDGRIRQNSYSEKFKNWLWHALPEVGKRKIKHHVITHLNKGQHAIEFIADGRPTLHSVSLNFSNKANQKLSFREKLIDTQVRKDFPDAQKLDCYTEFYGSANKPTLIFYNGGEEPKVENYRIFYWNGKTWMSIHLYDKNHKSETELDLGINIERPQPDDKQPLSEGWLAFNLGTTLRVLYVPFYIFDWNDDSRWVVYKVN